MRSLIGEMVGRYKIIEELGQGGMAVVYKGVDTVLDRNVAIKMILPDKQQTEKYLKRFNREAKALAQLSHPSIVKILDYGSYQGTPFLVMEFAGGGSLASEKNRNLSTTEAAAMLAQIANALHYSHQHKIIHRDVKPSNILFNEAGQPLLTDFGVAKLIETDESQGLTGTGAVVGTPAYMSPEQIQGKPVDGKSDIYSLGVVFFELVTGKKPYKANTPIEIALKHLNEPTPRSRQINRELSPEIDQVIYKAMAKKPEGRFQNMEVFAQALQKIATGKPKTDKIKAPRFDLVKKNPRYLSIFTVLAVITVSLIVGSILSKSSKNQKEVGANAVTPEIITPIKTKTIQPTIVSPTVLAEVSAPLIVNHEPAVTIMPSTTAELPQSSSMIQPANVNQLINLEKLEKIPIIELSWSPDGEWIINAGAKALRLIKPVGMATSATIDLNNIPKDIAVSQDNNTIYVLLGNLISGYDLQTQKKVADLVLTTGGANSLAVSPDKKIIAVGMLNNRVELLSIENGSTIRTLRSNFGGWKVAFSPNGEKVAVGSSTGVLMWEVETGMWLPINTGQNDIVKALSFSHNGKYLAAGAENIIRVWDPSTGDEIINFTGDFGFVYDISFSADDGLLASGSNDGIVRLWNLDNKELMKTLEKHTSPVYSVVFSPDGKRLVTGENDGNIFIWGLPQ